MVLSIGFIDFVSSADAIQATGPLTSAPVGLTPTEHASLSLDAPLRENSTQPQRPDLRIASPVSSPLVWAGTGLFQRHLKGSHLDYRATGRTYAWPISMESVIGAGLRGESVVVLNAAEDW